MAYLIEDQLGFASALSPQFGERFQRVDENMFLCPQVDLHLEIVLIFKLFFHLLYLLSVFLYFLIFPQGFAQFISFEDRNNFLFSLLAHFVAMILVQFFQTLHQVLNYLDRDLSL